MHRSLTIYAAGTPAPQPRPRMTHTGRAYNPPSADTWKTAVRTAWMELQEEPITGPVIMRLEFVIARPAGHWTKSWKLTKSAPAHHTAKPDLDNLVKSTCDALENVGAFPNDAAVISLTTNKRYAASDEYSGCRITLSQRD